MRGFEAEAAELEAWLRREDDRRAALLLAATEQQGGKPLPSGSAAAAAAAATSAAAVAASTPALPWWARPGTPAFQQVLGARPDLLGAAVAASPGPRRGTALQQVGALAAAGAASPAGRAAAVRAVRRDQFLELLRRHNSTLPSLRGQVVTASVLKVDKTRALLDPHFHGISELPKSAVQLDQVHAGAGGAGSASGSEARLSVSAGDTLRLRVSEVFTPYGDMQLQPLQRDILVKTKMVWAELVAASVKRRTVRGRVLNMCPGGYAVGLGGVVALLPYAASSRETAYNIGTLQPFLIAHMDTSNPPRSDLVILREDNVTRRGEAEERAASAPLPPPPPPTQPRVRGRSIA